MAPEGHVFKHPLVGTLGEERNEHHQVGEGKKPAVGLAGGFGGAGNETQVPRAGELVDVLDADASQAGNFRIGKDLLAGFDRNHGHSPGLLTTNPKSVLKSRLLSPSHSIRCWMEIKRCRTLLQ